MLIGKLTKLIKRCDATSAFAGRGKVRPFKVMLTCDDFIEIFEDIGNSWNVSPELIQRIEKYVCKMYGKDGDDINKIRYKMYCSSGGKIESELLPPCRDVLKQHVLRVNFISRIWKLATEPKPEIPSPDTHGWKIKKNKLSIHWMNIQPAQIEILEFLS